MLLNFLMFTRLEGDLAKMNLQLSLSYGQGQQEIQNEFLTIIKVLVFLNGKHLKHLQNLPKLNLDNSGKPVSKFFFSNSLIFLNSI